MAKPVDVSRVVRVFGWIGLTALGGGRTAYFYDAIVVRRRWVGGDEFVQDLTLSQLLPGSNVANLAIALGYRLAGLAGSVSGLLAVLVPGAIVFMAATIAYFAAGFSPDVRHVMHGTSAAVVGLVLMTTVQLIKPSRRRRGAALVAIATFVGVGPLHLNTAAVILVTGAVSVWLNRPVTR